MKKMTAAMLYAPGDVRVEKVDVPEVGPGEVLVKVKAALMCGTDRKMYRRGYPGIKLPMGFGHEYSGVIAEVGEDVESFKEGMRVIPGQNYPCYECYYCRLGRYNICETIPSFYGAFAEYAKAAPGIVKYEMYEIPGHIEFREAALAEPLACAVYGAEESNISMGDTVAVLGVGPIGLMFVRLAKLKGAKVIASGKGEKRLKKACELGADEVIDIAEEDDQVKAVKKLTKQERGADVVIEAIGYPETWEMALRMARKGGTVNLFGGCPENTTITVSTALIHYGELTIKGLHNYRPDHFRVAVDLLTRRDVDGRQFITKEFPLERFEEALKTLVEGEEVKIAVIP